MLMDLCISELEEVAREPQLSETPQPVIQESPHPYPDDVTMSNTVRIQGTKGEQGKLSWLTSAFNLHVLLQSYLYTYGGRHLHSVQLVST